MSERISLLVGTGDTFVQPDPAKDEWLSVEYPIWSSVVGPFARAEIESEYGIVAEVVES